MRLTRLWSPKRSAAPARAGSPFLRRTATPFTSLGVECLDANEETQIAFQKVRLARQLSKLPAPRGNHRRLPPLPHQAKASLDQSVQHLYEVASQAP